MYYQESKNDLHRFPFPKKFFWGLQFSRFQIPGDRSLRRTQDASMQQKLGSVTQRLNKLQAG